MTITPLRTFRKDPDSVSQFVIDWADWLPTGDAISTSTWTVPAGLTLVSDSETTSKATAIISSGTAGTAYEVKNRITTTDGLQDDRTIVIIVEER